MEKYTVQTTQKVSKARTNAHISLDWDREEFEEESTFSFDQDRAFTSSISLKDKVLKIDGGPVSHIAPFWLNNSSQLMGLSAAKYHKAAFRERESNYSGTVQELNAILENTLNLAELGENASYTLEVTPSPETGLRIKLTLLSPSGDQLFEQVTHQETVPLVA